MFKTRHQLFQLFCTSPFFRPTNTMLPSPILLLFLFLALLFSHGEFTKPPFSCDSSDPYSRSYPFCNPKLSVRQRAKDLVSRLTLDEKIAQLFTTAPVIPRLGIPAYEWWTEALHGVGAGRGMSFNGTITAATSFPQVILTASTFDSYLWYRVAQAIGREARGIYNAGQARGMTFWAPNINIFRDPRWGRGQETVGEDPLVSSKYAVAYVRGLQGDSFHEDEDKVMKGHLQTSACCKHFTAYDLDDWKDVNRYTFDARVSKQDLADTYQPPFESCVRQGRASGMMCSYNRVNGVPSCADHNLLTNTARRQWGFNGYIVSDCGAVPIIREEQGYAISPEDTVTDVLRAGMDIECGDYVKKHAKSAVLLKKLPVSQIDNALHNLFSIRIRLGLLDGNPENLSFGNIGPNQVCSKEHQHLALEAAKNGIVLLKNSAKLLPLPKPKPSTTISLAIIGPNANTTSLLGNYAATHCKYKTPLVGLRDYFKDAIHLPACHDGVKCSAPQTKQAVEVAKKADYVVLVMGLDQGVERESHDRVDLELPGKQRELVESVAKASKKPVVLVILSGGPVDISFAKDNDKIGGILWAGYPGEAGGTAIAQIIFGDHNPGGRLSMTWYPQNFTDVPMIDMRMRADPSSRYPGRTYRFHTGPKVYEFGFGLSYSKYSYKFISITRNKLHFNIHSSTHSLVENSETIRYKLVSELDAKTCQNMTISVTVEVQNHGNMAGKHPVLLFMKPGKQSKGSPMKQLVGFESVNLDAGQRTEVVFEVNPCEHLSYANEDGLKVIEEGSYFLLVEDEQFPIELIFH